MAPQRFALRSRRVLTPEGVRERAVLVEGGRIAGVLAPEAIPAGVPVFDAGERVVMPGLVDTHVHINEPGRTEWEGFETATQAAAAGGITTLVDMPLNCSPATTTAAALAKKMESAAGRCSVDVGFWGGVVPGNEAELEPLIDAGALGFKCFLVPSGIDEFPNVSEADLRRAMPVLARRGVPLLVHAELEGPAPGGMGDDPRRYATYMHSRPKSWENEAIRLMIRLCRETGCRVHIVHLSSSEALELLGQARREGLPFTAETCPHYLFFTAEEVPEGATHFKCSPPIREKENRERLWQGLRVGLIDFVVSDHSPCVPSLKLAESGDFLRAWGGISGLQFGLPAVWTELSRRGLGFAKLGEWMSARPADFAGLGGRKGRIAEGQDADLVVWDPDASFIPGPSTIRHRHKLTPYAGRSLKGLVESVYLRGTKVYQRDSPAPPPSGELLFAARTHEQLH